MKNYIDKASNKRYEPISAIINNKKNVVAYIYEDENKKFAICGDKLFAEICDNKLILKEQYKSVPAGEYNIVEMENESFKIDTNEELTIITIDSLIIINKIKNQNIRKVVGKTLMYIFLFILAITVLFPFYWMINTSLKTWTEYNQSIPTFWPHTVRWENYIEAFEKANLGYLFINTVYVGIVSTILSLVITVLSAFAFSRLEFPGRDTIFAGLLATMMIPGEMFTITNYATVHKTDILLKSFYTSNKTSALWRTVRRTKFSLTPGANGFVTPWQNLLVNLNIGAESVWTKVFGESAKVVYDPITFSDSYAALIIPFLVSVFYIYLLRQNFKQIPDELYYAAKVDGTSDFGYLLKVMIPLSAPTLVTITILKMMGAWNSYVWPRLITKSEGMKLITNGIRSASFQVEGMPDAVNFPLQMAAITIVTIPLFIVFLCFRKYIMRGVSKSGTKG